MSTDQSDGYSDMPLNTRQSSAISRIKLWYPIKQEHVKCVKICHKVISNVLYEPKEEKFRKLKLNNAKIQKTIVNIPGGVQILKLAGFEQKKEENDEILIIEEPETIEQLEQLTDIWLILLKTQFLWSLNNKNKNSSSFKLESSISKDMQNFFKTNTVAQSQQFQEYVKKSNDPTFSQTAKQRYNYFAKAIQLLPLNEFFDIKANHGLNDIDPSDIASMIVCEILVGYYDDDEYFTNLILAEDLRILAEQEKEFNIEQIPKYDTDEKKEEKLNENDNNEDDDDEKKSNDNNNDDEKEKSWKIIDIGCGWGNIGHCLMDDKYRSYKKQIEKESKIKNIDLYGFDISEEMLSIAQKSGYNKYYKNMTVMDCKKKQLDDFKDGTIDIIVSSNCLMQDKQIGHPNETFLIEANRLLKEEGWLVIARRFHGVHLGIQLYAYLMIAQQLGWKQMFASRIREVFFIGWKKMKNPTQ